MGAASQPANNPWGPMSLLQLNQPLQLTTNHLCCAVYEQKLAQVLFDGTRAASRPTDNLVKRG